MIDVIMKTRVCVQPAVNAKTDPYIHLSVQQVNDVCTALAKNCISYTVDENAISLDDGPEMTSIDIEPGADLVVVQRILDALPIPQITVDGKQIARGRMELFERAIAILRDRYPNLDWDLCDIQITVMPKKD